MTRNPYVCHRCLAEGVADPVVRSRFDQFEVRTEIRRADRTESRASYTEERCCRRHAAEIEAELDVKHARRGLGVTQQGLSL